MLKLQKKKIKQGTVLLFSSLLLFHSVIPSHTVSAHTKYDYSNAIYSEGTEDRYIYEANDKIVTTKTGVKRKIPETCGEYDLNYYPIPLKNEVPSKEIFALIKEENQALMNQVEQDIKNGTLKKHIAADGQFYGSISDQVSSVEKKIYLNTNAKGSHSLASYVPAGEVATVTLNEEALPYAKKGQIRISVGMTMIDATEYDYNHGKNNRMPYLGKKFSISQRETKVGTPFGGMVSVEIDAAVPSGLKCEVEVSGVVDTPYYQLDQTTAEEWKKAKKAPGLFAEIRTPYLRFIVPSYFIRKIENPKEACLFWTNVAALSSTIMAEESRTQPITLTFDDYITCGIAYASIGGWTCNLPTEWAADALTYDALLQSGSWGVIHEINHHYQRRYSSGTYAWGLGDENDFSEITNNALSAISYVLFTNIAAYRGENGTEDWQKVADPYSSLKQQIFEGTEYYEGKPNAGNFAYSTFAHEIGPLTLARIIQSTYEETTFNGITIPAYDYVGESEGRKNRNERYDDFAYRICVASERDYTWYLQKELRWPISKSMTDEIAALGYEKVIPVQSVYGMGEVGRETGRPYYVPSKGYTFDFEGSLVSPGTTTVTNVSKPKYGTLTELEDGTYSYTPGAVMREGILDEFVLTVLVEANGIERETQLNCTIGLSFDNVEVEHHEITMWDIYDALRVLETSTAYKTTTSSSMKITTDYGNNLAKASGYFTVAEAGEYTFQAYGDDRAVFDLQKKDGSTLRSLTVDYAKTPADAYKQSGATHFKVYLEANTPYAYTIIANNNGGEGWADVAVLRENENASWEKIQTVYGNLDDVGKKANRSFTPPEPAYVRPSKLAASDSVSLKGVTVLSTPQGVIPNGDAASQNEGDPNNIVDGDISTYFHSSYTDSNRTPFPHDYIFDLGSEQCFNSMEMLYRITGDDCGVIGDYEIYTAMDYDGNQGDWKLLTKDTSRHGNGNASKDIKISFPAVTARYVKIRVLNNRGTYNLSILAEVNFSVKSNVNQVIAQNSSYIQYKGTWNKDANGAYVNGATYNTKNGYFAYCFEGSETNIFVTKDAQAHIRVDGGEWRPIQLLGSLREPSAMITMEKSGKHTIEISAADQEIALNMISTDGTFYKGELPSIDNTLVIHGAKNIEIPVSKVSSFEPLEGVYYTDKLGVQGLQINVTGKVGTPAAGSNKRYKLTYTVSDYCQNTATVERYVTVTNQAPVINGLSDITITVGEGKDFDFGKGVTATDYEDGTVTALKVPAMKLSTLSAGEYFAEYKATDSDGNVTIAKRKIVVKAKTSSLSAVQKLTATGVSTDKMKLTWTKVAKATGYKVYRYSTAKKKYVLIKTINKNTTVSFTDSKLASGTSYKYKVNAFNKTVTSAGKTVSGTTKLKTAKISKITSSSKKAVIAYGKVTNATGYEIYRCSRKNGTYKKVGTVKSGKTLKYTDSRLSVNKTYYYKVRAYRVVGGKKVYGGYSAVKSVKVKR